MRHFLLSAAIFGVTASHVQASDVLARARGIRRAEAPVNTDDAEVSAQSYLHHEHDHFEKHGPKVEVCSTGSTVEICGISYYIAPWVAGKLSDPCYDYLFTHPGKLPLMPVTVVPEDCVQPELEELFHHWTHKDDVFQPAFLETIFLAGHSSEDDSSTFLGKKSTLLPLSNNDLALGPYFLDSYGQLFHAYRLYDDFQQSFVASLLQTPQGTFQPLPAQIASSGTTTIGVPSRLYFKATPSKPLAGIRIGIKDIYQLAGTRLSDGNRAYYHLYPPVTESAYAVQRLIDAGAIVVGAQTPSQFANGETPTADWVDYHSPFNPRGDGYNDPSSSSSGAGASMASYPWLDLALGSDTGGSIRGPAGQNGVFGNRPTRGLVSLENVMPLSPALDTAGFLVRDPYLWDMAQKVLYDGNYNSYHKEKPAFPTTIYTLGFPTLPNTPANTLLINFANNLASLLAGTVVPLNLEARWAATKPPSVPPTDTLAQFLYNTYPTLIAKDQTRLVRDPFYADYAAKHNGAKPFVDPVPLARWAYGDSLPAGARDQAFSNKTVFADWFNTNILPPSPPTCSSAFLLYVQSSGRPSPRNVYLSPPGVPFGFSNGRISPFAEVPDIVFPLGEVPVLSSITGIDELLPVTVSVLAARKCDGLIVRLSQILAEEGLIVRPKPGGTLEGGEILFKH